MHAKRSILVAVLAFVSAIVPASGQEDVTPGTPVFRERDVITFDRIDQIEPFLPPEFWDNRDFFVPILAPMSSRVEAYPYSRDHNFGPYGLSYADDRWVNRPGLSGDSFI